MVEMCICVCECMCVLCAVSGGCYCRFPSKQMDDLIYVCRIILKRIEIKKNLFYANHFKNVTITWKN